MDWFLRDSDLGHERVKGLYKKVMSFSNSLTHVRNRDNYPKILRYACTESIHNRILESLLKNKISIPQLINDNQFF